MNTRCDICRAPVFPTNIGQVAKCPFCLRVLCTQHAKYGLCEEHFSGLTEADQQAIIQLDKDVDRINKKTLCYGARVILIILITYGYLFVPALIYSYGITYPLLNLLWIPQIVGYVKLGQLLKLAKKKKETLVEQRQAIILKYPQQSPPLNVQIFNAHNQVRCRICNLLISEREKKSNGGLCQRHFSELSVEERGFFSKLFRSFAITKTRQIGLYSILVLLGLAVFSFPFANKTNTALLGVFIFAVIFGPIGVLAFFVNTSQVRERKWSRFLKGKIFTEIGIKVWGDQNIPGESQKQCNSCGRENPQDARFCNLCGKVLNL